MWVSAAYGAVECHDGGDDSIDFLGRTLFVGFDVSGWVGAHVNVIHHPAQYWMPTMCQASFEGEFHQLLRWWGHVAEALTERDDGEAGVFEVLGHLHGTPPVEGDLADVEAGSEVLDVVLYVRVVHDVALGRFEEALALPEVVGHVIPSHPQGEVIWLFTDEGVGAGGVAVSG